MIFACDRLKAGDRKARQHPSNLEFLRRFAKRRGIRILYLAHFGEIRRF